nr:MAG TPA: hypothetical protein [Caudoviricetes sp.]
MITVRASYFYHLLSPAISLKAFCISAITFL